jgi:hypothetical protein
MDDDGGLSERTKLREWFAVAIVESKGAAEGVTYLTRQGIDATAALGHVATVVLDFAQALTNEAMKRRKQHEEVTQSNGRENDTGM